MSAKLQYLLDTNVLSETRKKNADQRILEFLSTAEPAALCISVLTLGELRKGVALKVRSDPGAAKKIGAWVDGLELGFADRIVGIDGRTARLWGELSAERPRLVVETLLAATAAVHEFTFVTRNTSDIKGIKVRVFNPWESKVCIDQMQHNQKASTGSDHLIAERVGSVKDGTTSSDIKPTSGG